MKKLSGDLSKVFGFALVLFVYLLVGIILIGYYRYQMNPDGISFISIAEKYLQGDFSNAVNGYWGPLISWLLLPFLFFGLDSLLAAKLLTLLIGLVTIIGIRRLSFRFEMSEKIRIIVLWLCIPIVLYFSLTSLTPDLFIVCVLVFYFSIVFGTDFDKKRHEGIYAGLLGGFAYLAKAYAFSFFVVHFALCCICRFLTGQTKEQKKTVLFNFLLGMVVFLVISSPWIYLISAKYDRITFGTTGRYNFRLAGPESKGQLTKYGGFIKPPNESAVSAWEDPSYFEIKSWNPITSWRHQVKVILKNIFHVGRICTELSIFSIFIVFGYMLYFVRFDRQILNCRAFYPLLTIAVYCAGYSLIHFLSRFLWPIFILLLLMGAQVMNKLLAGLNGSAGKKAVIIVIFVLSFFPKPLKNLAEDFNADKDIYPKSRILAGHGIKGKLASNTNWREMLFLSYHLNTQYFGQAQEGISDELLLKELKKNEIDYYFFWSDGQVAPFLREYKEVTDPGLSGLRIYSIKQAN